MFLDAMAQALWNFGRADVWLFMMVGVIVGLVFGVIPGIGGILALSLMLPFVFLMTPEQVFPLMLGVLATVFQGGSISAILINVPGLSGSAATLLDGFPMTQKGEAGRALGAAQASSAAGCFLAVFLSLALIPAIFPIVMAMRTAEMTVVILFGLAFVATVSRGSMVKGLLSGVLGLLLSFIGFQSVTGVARFSFGFGYLYDGISLVPMCLGLFAIPEMVSLATAGGTLAKAGAVTVGMPNVWQGVKDVVRHWWLVLRSFAIGFVTGVTPGVGSSAAIFIAYAHAKQTSKHPERFGTGCVEGVIAPESCNNANIGGALLTTLAVGVPGSSVMALVIGAMIMSGLTPGPTMLTEHLGLSLTMVWVIAVAGIIGSGICIVSAPYLAKIAHIPSRILAPLVLAITFVGANAERGLVNDVIMTLIIGMLGLALVRYGYNRPALFLAFILGSYFENYLFLALRVSGPLFFLTPICLGIIFLTIFMFSFGPIKRMFGRRKGVKQA